MSSLNKVFLMGNLTRDPEIRFTPSGTAVGTLGLAVNESYKNKAGETVEETTFVDVEVWGRQAEVCGEHLKKGYPLFVEGRLKLDVWEKDGVKKSRLKIVCEKFQFIGGKKADCEHHESGQRPAHTDAEAPAEFDDDIPF